MSERVNDLVSNDASQPSIQHQGDSVTTGSIPVQDEESLGNYGEPRSVKRPLMLWLSVLGVVSVLAGAIAGVVWRLAVPLTTYHLDAGYAASTTERGLALYFASDAWFVLIGLVVGCLSGLLVWRWFAGLGWPVVFVALVSATVIGITCWQLGWLLGPGNFEERLAAAKPGTDLPVELNLHAYSALLVWPFAACTPVLLLSALAPDPDDPGPVFGRKKKTRNAKENS